MKVVLAHGVLGFGHDIPLLPHYFNGVKRALEQHGVDEVFEPQVNPVGSVSERAAEIGRFIVGRGQDVHIIAHSMGGLDARMAVRDPAVRRHVRSITTIGTPHAGAELADAIASGRIPAPLVELLKRVAPALMDLTTTAVPQIADVLESNRHIEIAGNAAQAHHESAFFQLAARIAQIAGDNDGVVSTRSAKRPERPLFATWSFDHGGEIGWNLIGALPIPSPGAPHLPHYTAIIDELRRRGL